MSDIVLSMIIQCLTLCYIYDMKIYIHREEEGTSSNRPELGSLLDALEMARRDEDLVYFGDSQAAIKVVLR